MPNVQANANYRHTKILYINNYSLVNGKAVSHVAADCWTVQRERSMSQRRVVSSGTIVELENRNNVTARTCST